MEKVKLTQEQADAIELAISKHDVDVVMDGVTGRWVRDELTPLNRFFPSELAKALYIGYEVEETFKVGDWVVRTSENGKNHELGRVLKINAINPNYVFERIDIAHSIKEVRHATPEEITKEKERRWWKSHNRDVWELREGDIILPNRAKPKDVTVFVVKEINDNYVFSELESYIHITSVKDSWKVICFAEDRKDV